MASIPQPATDGRGQPLSAPKPIVELYDLLWAESGNNPARPVLMAALHLEAHAADFLAACIYWRLVMNGPFWKFNEPPAKETAHYRSGDSWREELGIGEKAFYRARSTVATKNVTGHAFAATLAATGTETLVIYWTRDEAGTRLTWYDVRLELLCAKLGAALGLTVVANQRPPRVQRTLSTALAAWAAPAETCTPGTPAVATAAPALGREGGFHRKPSQRGITYPPYTNKEEEINEEDEKVVIRIAENLQQQVVAVDGDERYIYPEPAWEIAYRAHLAGLDVTAILEICGSHLAELRATTRNKPAEELVRMLTKRLRKWPLERRPDPTLDPTAQRFLDEMRAEPPPQAGREGAWRLDEAEIHTAEDRPRSSIAEHGTSGSPTDPQRRLWQAVLSDIQLQLTRATFDTWLRGTRLIAAQEGIYTIWVPSPHGVAWLENRLHRQIERTLEVHVGQPVALEFTTHMAAVP